MTTKATAKAVRFIEDQIAILESRGWKISTDRNDGSIIVTASGEWYDGIFMLVCYKSKSTNRWNLLPGRYTSYVNWNGTGAQKATTYREQAIMVDVYATDYVALNARMAGRGA